MTDCFEWQGKVGDVWADEWRHTDRALAPLNDALVAHIGTNGAPRTVLDVGCGAGATSFAIAAHFPEARILGIDLSESLVAVARERAGRATNLRFAVQDASTFDDPAFRPDVIVSRHGVMFFPHPVAAFTAIRRAAGNDAKLVFSCFRTVSENDWASAIAALLPENGISRAGENLLGPGPFAFADTNRVAEILASAGWVDAAPQAFDFDYVAGVGEDAVAQALTFFSRIGPAARAMRELPEGAARTFASRLEALLHQRHSNGTVTFRAAAWIWTARAGESQP